MEETLNHLFWECDTAKWVWQFIANWWSLSKSFNKIYRFSINKLMHLKGSSESSKIWHMVVAAAVWSIWLARNELVFQSISIRRSVLVQLVFTRVNKWGETSKLIPFTADPLWKTNPSGAISIYHNKLSKEFWKYKFLTYEVVCAIDGAWGQINDGSYRGAIGGRILNNLGQIIHVFSIPVQVDSGLQAEIEAMVYTLDLIQLHFDQSKQVAICSDSTEALQLLRKGTDLSKILKRSIQDFSTVLSSNVSLHYVSRDLNSEADTLAKEGLYRVSQAVYWTL